MPALPSSSIEEIIDVADLMRIGSEKNEFLQ